MSGGKRLSLYLFSVALVIFGMFIQYAFWPGAKADTVAGISHDLACPCECPMVLEDCHMSCGLEWKDMIGQKLKAGLTKEEINQYFFKRYGKEAMLTPFQRLNGKWYQLTRKGFPVKEGSLLAGIVFVWGGVVYLIIAGILSRIKGIASLLFAFLLIGAVAENGWSKSGQGARGKGQESWAPTSDRVLIPAGEFIMGSSDEDISDVARKYGGNEAWFADERPQRKVYVKSFYIDRFEVTNKQYKAFKGSHTYATDRENHPVVSVTWQDASDYCRWAGKRLPTEEEWEKAARGTDGRIYPWGNDFDTKRANTAEAGRGGRAKVGSYQLEVSGSLFPGGTVEIGRYESGVSPYGVYDMAGNVWEWTDTWYGKDKGLRVLKGGSWVSPYISSRGAIKLPDNPTIVSNDYGFRCAKDAEGTDNPSGS